MYSRAYIGDVTISNSFPAGYTPSIEGYQFVNIKGLFPKARTFGLEDDSYAFVYYDNLLYNYEQAFESFYSDGTLYYPGAYMYSTTGSAFGGSMGLMGAFVQDGYLAIMDSGMYAQYGEEMDGIAVLAYQDPQKKTYAGLIDLVTSMLLVREDLDPNPIYDERAEEGEDMSVAKNALSNLDQIIRRGPTNYVESFEGFLSRSFEQARSQVKIKNYLDLDNLQESEPIEMKPAAHRAQVTE